MSTVTDRRLDRLEEGFGALIASHTRGRANYSGYRDRPADFMREVLHFEPWAKQVEVIATVAHHKRTVVRGHHGAGKDAILAALMLWACYARDMLCIAVSATERQLIGQLWGELVRLWGSQFAGELYVGELRIGAEKRIVGMTSASTSNLTGWHNHRGTGVFVAISEAQGVQVGAVAFDAAEGNTAGEGSRICVVGNPVEPSGRFFEVHHKPNWHKVHISAFDHPNIVQDRVVIPGGPAPDWPADMAREYGADSPFYRARVLAEFPTSATDSLIRAELLDAAAQEERAIQFEAEVGRGPQNVDWQGRSSPATHATLGVDVAREGKDQTAIVVRRGPLLWQLHRWRESDTVENSRRITAVVRHLIGQGVGVSHVVVDEIAVGGGVHDELRRQLEEVWWLEPYVGIAYSGLHTCRPQLVGFKSSRRAPLPERFSDTRAQAFWAVRDAFERGRVAFRHGLDSVLLCELLAELAAHSYRHEGDDRIRIAAKDEARSRLGRSPDLADALAMSYAPVLERAGRKRVQWA